MADDPKTASASARDASASERDASAAEPKASAAEPKASAAERDAHAGEPVAPPTDPVEQSAPNQGATGSRPLGESPLSVGSETDAFAERPEAFVGAAFLGGLVLAQILRRFAR